MDSQPSQPSLHESLITARDRLQIQAKEPSSLIEYIPNAERTLWIQKVARNLLFCFVSCIGMIILCQNYSFLQDALFALFRWILIPVKPLLLAKPSASMTSLVTMLAFGSQVANVLIVPVAVYWAMITGRRCKYLYLRGDRLMLLTDIGKVSPGTNYSNLHLQNLNVVVVEGRVFLSRQAVLIANNTEVKIERPAGKKSYRDYILSFSTQSDSLSIRWGDIVKAKDRTRLLNELEAKLPRSIDSTLFQPFKALPDKQSYTNIWLKELSGAPKRDRLTPLASGSSLDNGNYTVQKKAGVGGQGIVYYAQSAKHNTSVVLKEFVLPVYPDLRVRKKAAERFQAEATMLSRLDHPQIVKFIDLFVEDHRAYVVMESVEGTTLKDLVLAEGPLPESAAIELVLQVAQVLTYLHGQNPPVIHRDVTPDNIMLGADGLPKLIDFSVAQESSFGVTGSVVGKPNYISPEQFRGKPSVQSDIYSLGATLYFLLVGSDPPPITVLHPQVVKASIGQALDQITARCTQLDVNNRYESATDLVHDLSKLKAHP